VRRGPDTWEACRSLWRWAPGPCSLSSPSSPTSSASPQTPDLPPFACEYDEALAAYGPPSIFTLDPSGKLRVDPERTREIYLMDPALAARGEREAGHWLLTDERTGLRLYLYVTHPDLARRQARGTVVRHPTAASAIAEAMAQWAVPVAEPAVD